MKRRKYLCMASFHQQAAFAAIGLAPRTTQWACGLRGGGAQQLPRDLPRPKTADLDTGFGARRRRTTLQPSARGSTHVNMLGLANTTRKNWRNATSSVRELFTRWRSATVRRNRLQRRQPPQPSDAERAAALTSRVLAADCLLCLRDWHEATAAAIERMLLVGFFRPRAMRSRRRACFSALARSSELASRVAAAARRIGLARALRRWAGVFMAQRRHQSLLMELADVARSASPTRSRAAILLESVTNWRQHLVLLELSRGHTRLCSLAHANKCLARAIAIWVRYTATYHVRLHAEAASRRACAVARLRRGFTRLLRLVLAARRGSMLDHAFLEDVGRHEDPRTRHGLLVTRVAHRRLCEGMKALREELRSAHSLEWAELHASSRGRVHMQLTALRRWYSTLTECPVPAPYVSCRDGAARLVRIYGLRTGAEAGRSYHAAAGFGGRGALSMADVLRSSDLQLA